MENQAYLSLSSPIGRIGVWSSDKGVTKLEIGVGSKKDALPAGKATEIAKQAQKELAAYFDGTVTKFTVPVDLEGTEFQKAVWAQIYKLGFGKFKSYGEIAKAMGKPQGSRAVGGAVGANPVPLIVGCHRVMGSSGTVTGYSGGKGVNTKLWLLEHEAIPYQK